jgi:hypothetical protein
MTTDLWSEDARGIWQSQESVVTRMSGEDMRERATRWNIAFARTKWIAFACAGVLLAFFILMLFVSHGRLQHVGALVGITAGIYLSIVGVRLAGRRWVDEGATCVGAYKMQLERRREAEMASARAILLSLTGCALLSESADWLPWSVLAVSQLTAGLIAYAYITRQARRFQRRIEELARLESD